MQAEEKMQYSVVPTLTKCVRRNTSQARRSRRHWNRVSQWHAQQKEYEESVLPCTWRGQVMGKSDDEDYVLINDSIRPCAASPPPSACVIC